MDTDRNARDLKIMRDSMSWPMLLLPVKRSNPEGGFPACGVMLNERPRVYLVDMYEMKEHIGKPLDQIPHKDYPTLVDVVDDGWTVD